MPTLSEIESARKRISAKVKPSPLIPAARNVKNDSLFLKLENMHRTGSFKERGALNKLMLLKEEGKYSGVVAASAGNHAQAVSYHGKALGFDVTIVMPEHAPLTKVISTQRWGANVKLFGKNFDEAVDHARSLVTKDQSYVHAFNDDEIVAGQGTLGLELLEQMPNVDTVVIPVGGGGLAGGTAMAIKEKKPSCRVIGVQAETYPYTYRAFKDLPEGDRSTHIPPSIADGIATKKVGSVTIPILKKYVDDMVLVSEGEMADGVLELLECSKLLAEGAGAAAYAAVISGKVPVKGNTVAVISGGNIDVNIIEQIIEKGLLKSHRLVRLSVVIPDRPGGLKGLTSLLADVKANIHQIHHERASNQIPVFATGTDLTLETRGDEHVKEIVAALSKQGYAVKVQD